MGNLELARLDDNTVVERLSLPDTVVLEQTFSQEFIASLQACDASVQVGWQLNGTDFEPQTLVIPSLDSVKAGLKARIDSLAETERLQYITDGVGQAMTYQQKSAEATAYLAATNPVASDYPMLSAEVGTTGETLADVATVIKAAFEQWQMIGAAIEKVRLSAKKAISDAETSEAAHAIFDAVIWPSA